MQSPTFVVGRSAERIQAVWDFDKSPIRYGDAFKALCELCIEVDSFWKRHLAERFSTLHQDFPRYALSRFDTTELQQRLLRLAFSSTPESYDPIVPLLLEFDREILNVSQRCFPSARFIFVGAGSDEIITASAKRFRSVSSTDQTQHALAELSTIASKEDSTHCAPELCEDRELSLAVPLCGAVSPLFILGAARSGTSVITAALKECAGFGGWDEGHLIPFIGCLLGQVRMRWDCERVGISFQQIREAVLQQTRDCYGFKAKGRWLEKTPDAEMIAAVPLIKELYPNAKFIYVQRDALSCVLSRQIKFGQSVSEASYLWSAAVQQWQQTREILDDSEFIELEQREFTYCSEKVAAKIAQFLNLDDGSREQIAMYLRAQRPQVSRAAVASEKARPIFSDLERGGRLQMVLGKLMDALPPIPENRGWSEEEKQTFDAITSWNVHQLKDGDSKALLDWGGTLERIALELESVENHRYQSMQEHLLKQIERWQESDQRLEKNLRKAQSRAIGMKRLAAIAALAGSVMYIGVAAASLYSTLPRWFLLFVPGMLLRNNLGAISGFYGVLIHSLLACENASMYVGMALSVTWVWHRLKGTEPAA